MRPTSLKSGLIALAMLMVAITIVLAACGGDDNSDADSADDSGQNAAEAGTPEPINYRDRPAITLQNAAELTQVASLTMPGFNINATRLDFRPDSTLLAVAANMNLERVLMFDTSTGEKVLEFPAYHGDFITGMDMSADGGRIATIGGDRLYIWYMAYPTQPNDYTADESVDVAFDPNNHLRVAVTNGGVVRYRGIEQARVATPSWEFEPDVSIEVRDDVLLEGNIILATCLDWSADGTRHAVGWFNGRVRIYDVVADELTCEIDTGGPLFSVTFSPDGSRLLVATQPPGQPRIVDSATCETLVTLPGVVDSISSAYSPDGTLVATGGTQDGRIRVWNSESGELITELERAWGIADVAFSPDGTLLASATDDEVTLWGVPAD